uniref:protein mono-ADP-ribosyltransferase PARP14-like n=1 Tax=Styela clava TaxID=7725 RepID=UPI0019395EA6|nr:protein mono-ADP-ribosyltransferase PARP14-like [Styela clava]
MAMDETVVNIIGLPLTCNPVKIKVRFQSECDVSIDSVKVDHSKSEIILNSKEDAEKFRKNLPKSIKFGDTVHNLALYEDETASDSVDSSTTTEQELSPTPVAQKEDENLTIQNVQYWDTMVPLPLCKYGLLVQLKDETITTKNVHDYFSSNQLSCGGPIRRMQCMIDGILILFQDAKTAEKVWKFRPHRIANRPIKIFLKTIPTVYHDKLLYKPQKQNMSDQEIKTLLVGISPKQTSPTTVKRYDSNNILISYEADVGLELKTIMLEFKKRLNENISQLPKTDCLRVKGFPSDISDEEIIILFENKQRTGGGPVTKIQHLDNDVRLVYFASYEDATDVINKFRGKTLPVFNTSLKISKYFHFMFDKNNNDIAEDSGNTSDYSSTSTLSEGKFRWLVDCKMAEQIKNQYKVKIVFNERDKTITYIGDKDEVTKGQKAVTKMLKNVTRKVFDSTEKDFVHFLLYAKSNLVISRNALDHLRNKGINAIVAVDNNIPFIWGYKTDCESALYELNKSILSVCEVPVSPNVQDTVLWESIKNLESNGLIKVYRQSAHIKIVGFRESVVIARQLLTACLIDDDDGEELLKLNYDEGVIIYILEHTNFKKLCSESFVKIVKTDNQSITLKGTKQSLQKVENSVKDMTTRVVHTNHIVEKFGLLDFMRSSEGKTILKQTSSMYKVVILCNKSLKSSQFMDTSTHVASSSLQNKPSVKIGGIVITVKQGDITDEDSDVILNSAGVSFSSPSIMTKAILDKGGSSIQHELNSLDNKYFRVTSSGKLECRKIFHCTSPLITKDISTCLWNALKETEKRYYKSISIPAIGTGISGISVSEVSRIMMEIFHTFANDSKTQYVKSINVVVLDPSHMHCFKTALKEIEMKGATALGATGASNAVQTTYRFPVMIGPLAVSVRQGDITEEKNDAIVNSTGENFDLSKGLVSNAIIEKGGWKIQQEVYKKYNFNIRVSSGGRLPCNKIIHVFTPLRTELFINRLVKVLEMAETECCKSISLPAIGTGNLKFSVENVANTMVKAFDTFSQKHPVTNYLKVVDIVIFDRTQLQYFIGAVTRYNTEKKGEKSNKSWVQNLPGMSYVSETVSIISKAFSSDEPMQRSEDSKDTKKYLAELHIYSLSKDINETALQIVLQKFDEAYNYNKFPPPDFKQQINSNGSGKKTKVEGLKSDVSNAGKSMQQNRILFVWQWMNKKGKWVSFESEISDKLEDVYRINPAYHGEVTINGVKHMIDIGSRTFGDLQIKRNIWNGPLQQSQTTESSHKSTSSTHVDKKKAFSHKKDK